MIPENIQCIGIGVVDICISFIWGNLATMVSGESIGLWYWLVSLFIGIAGFCSIVVGVYDL